MVILCMGWLNAAGLFTFPWFLAWLANGPLIICLIIMLWGRLPNFWLASAAFCFALLALFPTGNHPNIIRGMAVYIWLASVTIMWAANTYAKFKAHSLALSRSPE
jgi:hypothetical protein